MLCFLANFSSLKEKRIIYFHTVCICVPSIFFTFVPFGGYKEGRISEHVEDRIKTGNRAYTVIIIC